VGEQQPALIQLDGRAAIADLYELPRELGLEDWLAAVPYVQIGGIDEG